MSSFWNMYDEFMNKYLTASHLPLRTQDLVSEHNGEVDQPSVNAVTCK